MTLAAHVTTSACLLALAAPAAAGAQDTSPPSVHLRRRPVLYIATPQPGGADQPVAWVTFRTRRHVNARLTVVRFADRSGRSFAGAADCIRSTFVDADGRRPQRPGRRYAVSIYVRDGIGRSRTKRPGGALHADRAGVPRRARDSLGPRLRRLIAGGRDAAAPVASAGTPE